MSEPETYKRYRKQGGEFIADPEGEFVMDVPPLEKLGELARFILLAAGGQNGQDQGCDDEFEFHGITLLGWWSVI